MRSNVQSLEAWRAKTRMVRCERFGTTMTPDACRRYRRIKPYACKGCAGGLPAPRIQPVEKEVDRPTERITGARVRAVRIERGLTQAQVAKRLNVSDRLVSAWETGRVAIYKDYLPKLEKWIATGKWR